MNDFGHQPQVREPFLPSRDQEAVLMVRASQGELFAFECLVNGCQARLIQYFRMLPRVGQQAEDLAQETFIKLYKNRHRYRAKAPFRSYLYRIAHNVWIDWVRRVAPRDSVTDPADQGMDQFTNPEPQMSPSEHVMKTTLIDAVLRLPSGQREVLLLLLIEDMSYGEIGHVLNIPQGTVKSRVFYAVKNLRNAMGIGGGSHAT